eukprot:NODE_8195_length_529_cov_2.191667_g7140_i0.p5 GENE.NODE_8195_length_529_cov_2.191667_g7140_i0~~NODE_8195_length_529_cov_2.191667_g7140_i0.p5  ORF type:complete len:58 (-),score=4.16 NODE_8195_length_529_cov_2.191667_g7140_i0:185-358(-)
MAFRRGDPQGPPGDRLLEGSGVAGREGVLQLSDFMLEKGLPQGPPQGRALEGPGVEG